MNTEAVVINAPMPTHFVKYKEQAKVAAAAAAGGIRFGSFTRLSISGGKFHLIKEGALKLITDPHSPQGQPPLPLMRLEIVVLGSNPALSKQFYRGQYVPGSGDEPDCASDDGVRPDSSIASPVHHNCAECPMNMWGSKITPEGKKTKACADNKRLVIVPAMDMNFEPIALNITPASLTPWGKFVDSVTKSGRPIFGIVAALTFDPTVSFPKLRFNFSRDLTEAEADYVLERSDSEEVRNIIAPRANFTPALPAPTVATEPVISTVENHAAAVSNVTFSPPTIPTIPASQVTAKAIPSPWAAALSTASATVQAAVTAVGGIDTELGQTVFLSMTKVAAEAPPADDLPAAKRTRRTKANIEANKTAADLPPSATVLEILDTTGSLNFGGAPVSPPPVARPAAVSATSFVTPPVGNVAPGGPGSIDLSAMLDKALGPKV